MASPRSVPPPVTVTSSTEVVSKFDPHKHRRRLIGPLLSTAISTPVRKPKRKKRRLFLSSKPTDSSSDSDSDSSISDVIRNHALEFFIGRGGKREDWGETEARSVRADMLRRWRESEWGKARQLRKEAGRQEKWVGGSFDVGTFLGMDVIDKPYVSSSMDGASSAAEPSSSRLVRPEIRVFPPSAGADTFVTAQSHVDESTVAQETEPPLISQGLTQEPEEIGAADSATALLGSTTSLPAIPPPQPSKDLRATHSDTHLPLEGPNGGPSRKGKGKAKVVNFEEPAPPSEVLARTGSAVDATSAGAAEHAQDEVKVRWGDIVMRDRMLVRMSYTEDSVAPTFDEAQNRTTRHLENEGWMEYIVAWRKNRLELYKDHRTIGKEWLTGHKRLTYVVPLSSTSTRFSLYSFVDLTFAIQCPPTPVKADSRRHRIFGSTRGTNIFVFKHRCRSRAVDWVWRLWRTLDGELPPYIEVRCPLIDTRIKVDVPKFDMGDFEAAFDVFRKENIIDLCEKQLRAVRDFHQVLEHERAHGASFELAWRLGTNLDWVWQSDSVEGSARRWAVLCGIALKQAGSSAHLEFRLRRHLHTHLHIRDGTRLVEPPGVEGYVERIRPNSQNKQALYLATHDGYLFALPQLRANQPVPPGLKPSVGALGVDEDDKDAARKAEVQRGAQQIIQAAGMTDLRNIVAVRRAFQLVPRQADAAEIQDTPDWEDTDAFWEPVEQGEEDFDDDGGDAGLAKAKDKGQLKLRRSFELLLVTGQVARFEVHSCQAAIEWIVRLRPLVSYWRKRHQADARQEMDIAHYSTGRARITPQRHREHGTAHHDDHDSVPEAPPARDTSLPDLDFFFNWCVLDGCRPILKCGRLYARKGWWGPYKHTQLVLVAGCLVQYHITARALLHHRKKQVIGLLDAYVCSGYFAAQYLPTGQYNASAQPVARRYQDGLETDDTEEDTLIIIWYRNVPATGNGGGTTVPPLNAKRKVAIFRTRSKLERDAWVWAINAEIEKVVRASREREEAVRMAGQLLPK